MAFSRLQCRLSRADVIVVGANNISIAINKRAAHPSSSYRARVLMLYGRQKNPYRRKKL